MERAPRRVLVLYTGGTIGMTKGPRGYEPVGGYFEDLVATFPTLHDATQPRFTTLPSRSGQRLSYRIDSFDPPLDSADLSLADWARFAEDIRAHHDEHDGFVVVHGTDTMAYTASALAFMLDGLS